jgi:hypothetical protein
MSSNPYLKTLTASNPLKKEKVVKPKVAFIDAATSATINGNRSMMAEEEKEALRAEILAMGGNEEDLKLIQDVDSDSEVEGEADESITPQSNDLKSSKKGKSGKDVSLTVSSSFRFSILKTFRNLKKN